jgi:hypothetical protein
MRTIRPKNLVRDIAWIITATPFAVGPPNTASQVLSPCTTFADSAANALPGDVVYPGILGNPWMLALDASAFAMMLVLRAHSRVAA